MNKSFLVVILPPLAVLIGYIVLFRRMGIAPNYLRLILATAGFLGAAWWVRRRAAAARRTKSTGQ